MFLACLSFGQSGRVPGYSETPSKNDQSEVKERPVKPPAENEKEDDVIRIDTDLVVIPVQVSGRKGQPVIDLKQDEFKIFENGIEQEISYFSDEDRPFTVALMLDMSYSSVFKLQDIQAAAWTFVSQLRENDRVMIVSFAEKARVLCEPTNDRRVLRLAIEGAKIASGTSLYSALDLALKDKFSRISGRKAVVLLSDGVDTTSKQLEGTDILNELRENEVLVYPIQYDTYDDVQKSRHKDAQILYDDNDKPYIVERAREKGERETDYAEAREFFKDLSDRTGGRVYRVSSTTNLGTAFARIASELRKTYSIGYYPETPRYAGEKYAIKVRVYRPGLTVRARENYFAGDSQKRK
jgi:Ca-activated chloride channel family protein